MSVAASTARPTPAATTAQPSQNTASKYTPGPGSLNEVSGGATISRGQSGPAVLDLQQKLNAAGMQPPLAEDGLFGPKTKTAVRAFQRSNSANPNLSPDGVFGGQTLSALAGGGRFPKVEIHSGEAGCAPHLDDHGHKPNGTVTAASMAMADVARRGTTAGAAAAGGAAAGTAGRAGGTFGSSPQQRAGQAETLLQRNNVPLVEGKTYVVQIDQDLPPPSASSAERNAHLRSYSGQTSVFRAEGGHLVEVDGPFRSAGHPGQKATRSQKFTDVNRDGKDDIAHLRPGVYEYGMRATGGGRFNPVDNKQISVARDINHDGTISEQENNAAKQNNMTAAGLQWHAGGNSRPSSVGCQTMPPGDFARFRNAVQGGEGGSFTYLLAHRSNDKFGANPL